MNVKGTVEMQRLRKQALEKGTVEMQRLRKQALEILEQLYLFSSEDEVKDVEEFLDPKKHKDLICYLKDSIKIKKYI